MQLLYLTLGLLLLLTLGAGIWRALRGPTAADRMLAVQVFGTTAVATLLLLAQGSDIAALRDVALVFALVSGRHGSGVRAARLAGRGGRM